MMTLEQILRFHKIALYEEEFERVFLARLQNAEIEFPKIEDYLTEDNPKKPKNFYHNEEEYRKLELMRFPNKARNKFRVTSVKDVN